MNATRLKICSSLWASNQGVSFHVQILRLNEDRVQKLALMLINA